MWLFTSVCALADSPLTSVDWSAAYSDLASVSDARSQGVSAALKSLTGDLPVDEKLAIVSALGWGKPEVAMAIAVGLARKRGVPVEALRLDQLSSSDRAVLGYAIALGDYFDLAPLRRGAVGVLGLDAPSLVKSALQQRPDDFALAMLAALIEAQDEMDGPWCEVWRTWESVLGRFPEPKRNVRPAAVKAGTDYLHLYRDECPKPPVAPGAGPSDESLDQIYDLVRYNDLVVAATQGGITAFDLKGKVRSWRAESLCVSAAVVGSEVWVACNQALLRFDGARFTEVMRTKDDGEGAEFQITEAADGPYLMHGGTLSKISPDGRIERVVDIGSAYDVTIDSRGQRWSIDFLNHIDGAHPYALKSEGYPGSDPRSLVVAKGGGLWVADFESGYLRYDPKADRFVPFAAGPPSKGSDLAVDIERDRVWLLHYTDGLVLVSKGQPHKLALADLQYLRAIALDPDGSAWVAGWNGLAHVRFDGERFTVERMEAVR